MGLIEEIAKKTGQIAAPWRITWLTNACFIEGVKRVLCISQEKIEVQLTSGRMVFGGEGLFLREYAEGDGVVCGTIVRVERV